MYEVKAPIEVEKRRSSFSLYI